VKSCSSCFAALGKIIFSSIFLYISKDLWSHSHTVSDFFNSLFHTWIFVSELLWPEITLRWAVATVLCFNDSKDTSCGRERNTATTDFGASLTVSVWILQRTILGDPGAASRDDGIFIGESLQQERESSCCKLSPMKIPLSRLAAPGSPRMAAYLHVDLWNVRRDRLVSNLNCICVILVWDVSRRWPWSSNHSFVRYCVSLCGS